jgi:integrase
MSKVIQLTQIGEICDAYLAARRDRVACPHSIEMSTARVRKWFGQYDVADIRQGLVNRVSDEMLKTMAPGTAVNTIRQLRTVMNLAHSYGWVTDVTKLRVPVAKPASRGEWVTKEQAAQVIEAADRIGLPHTKLLLQLAFSTAKRKEALLELEWSSVDFLQNTIDFGEGNSTKRRGTIPMSDWLRQVLVAEHASARSIYVVSYAGHRLRDPQKGIDRACEAAGVPRFTLHICRHSACTWMAADGLPMRKIANYAGMSEGVAERVYAKFNPDHLSDAARSLALG